MDGESKPRGARSGPRRLKDISHLYLSGRPVAQVAPPVARALRLGFVAGARGLAKVEVCGNLAVQFARLRRRTLVLDLDHALPNVGFRLGLEPEAYLAHLDGSGCSSLHRSLLGLRVIEGLAGAAVLEPALSDAMRHELRESECLLVSLPPLLAGAEAALSRLESLPERVATPSTAVRVAPRSPMFDSWLATARRASGSAGSGASAAASRPLDALLCVHDGSPAPGEELALRRLRERLAPTPVHLLWWGATEGAGPAWALLPAHPTHSAVRQPLSSLYPEHPASRRYESLAQALLAGLAAPGGSVHA